MMKHSGSLAKSLVAGVTCEERRGAEREERERDGERQREGGRERYE